MKRSIDWVAGLLEGEGSFYAVSKHSVSPRIACNMTDYDVLQDLHETVGIGTLNPIKKRKEHWKDAWIWRAQGEPAAQLMKQIRPLMGQRRGQKIDELLTDWYTKSKKHRKLESSGKLLKAVEYYINNQESIRVVAEKFEIGRGQLFNHVKLRREDNK